MFRISLVLTESRVDSRSLMLIFGFNFVNKIYSKMGAGQSLWTNRLESVRISQIWNIKDFSLRCPNPATFVVPQGKEVNFYSSSGLRSPPIQLNLDSSADGTKNKVKNVLKAEMFVKTRFTVGHENVENRIWPNHLSIFLCPGEVENCSDNVRMLITVSVVHPYESLSVTSTLFYPMTSLRDKTSHGWNKAIAVSRLWNDGYIVDDTLKLKFDISCSILPSPRSTFNFPQLNSREQVLSRYKEHAGRMELLLASEEGADFTIHCHNTTFRVHSQIIKAHSPVFKNMLDSNMLEANSMVMDIADVDPDDLLIFLKYLYTGSTQSLTNSARCIGVSGLANKYQVDSLKTYCFQCLVNQLTVDNVGEIAVLAQTFNVDLDVRKMIVNFCSEHWSTLQEKIDFIDLVKTNVSAFQIN